MKRTYVLTIAFLFSFASMARAADSSPSRAGAAGLGVALGQPMGATAKFWFSNMSAVDAMVGYHIDNNIDLHSDFLLHAYPFSGIPHGELPLYVGLGGRVLAGDDTQFGIRVPLGLSYFYLPGHLEVFAEVAPVIRLNDIEGSIDGLVGLRIYTF